MNSQDLTRAQLAGLFDHTFLKAFATEDIMKKLCAEARQIGAASVAVNPCQIALCKELLKGSKVKITSTISFPLGQTTIAEKVSEATAAAIDGANEIDYVLNVGRLLDGDTGYIREEMAQITQACHAHGALCKVIFENCYLSKDQIREAAQIAKEVRPDFIKTSTGFGTSGATVEDVRLMKQTAGDAVKVKAAGGIRDLRTCLAMIDAGAERIGTSHALDILKEFDEIHKN